MTAAIWFGIAGLLLAGVIPLVRIFERRRWLRSLQAYRLIAPRKLTPSEVANWLAQVSAYTTPPRWSLLPAWPIVIEIDADRHGISHTLLVPRAHQTAVLAALRASLPGVRIEELDKSNTAPAFTLATELRVTSSRIPLGDERVVTAANGLLAALQPMPSGLRVRVQWLLAGQRSAQSTFPDPADLASLLTNGQVDRKAAQLERQKQRAPLLLALGRVAASGGNRAQAGSRIQAVLGALRVLETPGVKILRRWLPSRWVRHRLVNRSLPVLGWPVILNVLEAVATVALPLDGVRLPGLPRSRSRQLPPTPDTPKAGTVIGESRYPSLHQSLALKPRDRLMHTYVLGPSGTGKSTLLATMALQDIAAKFGVIVLDPKADLINEILARIPEERLDDVLLLDPSNTDQPLGFNPLQSFSGSEHERELAAETITHILHDIFRDFWGPRTDDLLRAAVLSLVQVPAPNGEPFAMTEIAELLTNDRLRHYVCQHPRQHQRWREYWQIYNNRSPADQLQMIGPVLNKLHSFTHRTSLRLVLGQARGINLDEIFSCRKILLVPLSKGQIGSEAAALIGSLLIGSLWAATLRRSTVPPEKRLPVFGYFDEFQDVVRLSDDLADVLAQARGLGLGITLAHQYVKQVPGPIQSAVLGTARSQIFFQTEYDDAQIIGKRLAPVLTADDLMNLGAYEIAARLAVNAETQAPVTGVTLPLSEPQHDPIAIRRQLAADQGRARAEIEGSIAERAQLDPPDRPRRFGEVES